MDVNTPMADDSAAPTLNPGTRLGKYEIVKLLGAGGMGAVYEAIHLEIGKRVAVKVLSPSIAAIPGTRGRFLREAQLTSRVHHPNIVDVTDMGNEGAQTFLVMELFRGEDLAQRVAREGHLVPQDLADIMLPVCSAVIAAHEAGVTHRDLKPSNIFLAESQRTIEPKILDFGISKSVDSTVGPGALTGTGAMVGTPYYLAPEQIMDNRSAGPASDQYALGVILYECLTGVRPFQGENLYTVFRDIVAGAPRPPRTHRPEILPALEQVVLRAMHVDPKQRYGSTKDLGRALLPFASRRVMLIWQDVFGVSEPVGDGDRSGRISTGRAVAVTRVLTPSASAEPAGPVGLAGGTQIASVVPKPRLPGNRFQLSEIDDFPGPVDFRPKPSRTLLHLAIAGAIIGGGAFAWWQFSDTPTTPGLTEGAKKKKRSLARTDATSTQPAEVAEPEAAKPVHPPETFDVSVVVDPDFAMIELDGRPLGRGRLERSLPLDHKPHRLRLAADGYEPELIEFTDVPPPKRITLTRPAAATTDQPSGRSTKPVAHRKRKRGSKVRVETGSNDGPKDTGKQMGRARDLNPNGAPIIN